MNKRQSKDRQPQPDDTYIDRSNKHSILVNEICGNRARCIDSGYQGVGPYVSIEIPADYLNPAISGGYKFTGNLQQIADKMLTANRAAKIS